MGLVSLRHVDSSQTRDRTQGPCLGRWISYPLHPPPGNSVYMVLGKGPISFLSMWIFNYTSTIYWEDCPFPYWMVLSSFDSHLTICVRIYFLAFFLSVGLSLMPKILFWFCSFIVSFESGSVNFSNFVLTLQDCFWIFGTPYKFQGGFSIFARSIFLQELH